MSAEKPLSRNYNDTLEGKGKDNLRTTLRTYDPNYKDGQLERSSDSIKAIASLEAIKRMNYSPAQQKVMLEKIGIHGDALDRGIDYVIDAIKNDPAGNFGKMITEAITRWQSEQKGSGLKADGVLGRKSLEYADTKYDLDAVEKKEKNEAELVKLEEQKSQLKADFDEKKYELQSDVYNINAELQERYSELAALRKIQELWKTIQDNASKDGYDPKKDTDELRDLEKKYADILPKGSETYASAESSITQKIPALIAQLNAADTSSKEQVAQLEKTFEAEQNNIDQKIAALKSSSNTDSIASI